MFIIKNAWRSIVRSKGRSILVGLIVVVIALAATIALSINNAAALAKTAGLADQSITASISVDREKLMQEAQSSSSSDSSADSNNSTDPRDAMQQAITGQDLSLTDYEKYAKASSVPVSSYYSQTESLSATSDGIQPVSTSTSDSSTDNSSTDQSSGSSGDMPGGGMPGGGQVGNMGDFQLIGYSDDTALTNAQNGSFTMTEGQAFDYDSDSADEVIINSELATYNDLKVGDEITLANTSDSTTTYTFKIVGIYTNASSSTSSSDSSSQQGPSGFSAMDPANAIYTNTVTVEGMNTDDARLSYTYVLDSAADLDTFTNDIEKAGLSDDYTVSSADVETYEESLVPLNNLSSFATTFLWIILAIGAIVLVVINLFNVRERKYEIGVMTAIGVKKSKVTGQFVIEFLIITMIGTVIGIAGGALLSNPIANKLLASQISSAQSQTADSADQLGRSMMPNGGAPDGMPGGQGGPGSRTAVDYLSNIDASVGWKVIGIMIAVGLLLAAISAIVSVINVTRYEPLQILADRS